jgi:uncharacterized protein (TIGR00369 family)
MDPIARPTKELLARYAEAFNRSKTLQYFGVRIDFPNADRVVASIEQIRPEQRGGLGTSAVNGGVLAALFDLVIGCTPALLDPVRRTATMQLSMSFERPLQGNSLRAEARIDAHGKSTLFASAQIFDERGVECARCQGVVRISELPWQSEGGPAVN